MKMRWAASLGWMMMAAAAVQAQPLRDAIEVRDAEGKLYAVAVICNDCKADSKSAKCAPGAADGWADGKPCGSCLLKSNFQTVIKYPYDIHFTGKLVDPKGKPIGNRFVKMMLPNGWGVRSKTTEAGTFRLMLGATETRKDKKPIVIGLGERVDVKGSEDEQFSIYLMAPGYNPCSGSEPDKPEAKNAVRTKAQ